MKSVRRLLLYTIYLCAASRAASVPGAALKLNLRTRVEAFQGSGDWLEVHFEKTLRGTSTGAPAPAAAWIH
ncbi:MAG: hypothetical protein DMG58_11340 [Acidobacteria bacterium]|nr:MAG: hypothetical protein DMG58_11340 [Acidobacteriota bacterium]